MITSLRHPFEWPPGFGTAVRTDNTADQFTRTTSVPPSDSFTMMAWIRLITNRGGGGSAFQSMLSFDQNSTNIYVLQTTGDGVTLNIWNGSADFSGSVLTVGVWYHVALVVAGSSGSNVFGYLNGRLDITGTAQAHTLTTLQISNDADSNWADCRYAAVKIWNKALSAVEVAAEMRQYVPVNTQGLNSFFPMCGPISTLTSMDWSGHNRNLTAAGTLTFEIGPPVPWNAIQPVRFIDVPAAAAGGGSAFPHYYYQMMRR